MKVKFEIIIEQKRPKNFLVLSHLIGTVWRGLGPVTPLQVKHNGMEQLRVDVWVYGHATLRIWDI